jgi:hypothetical protein
MLPKSVIACLAAAACVATTALMPTVASAGRGGPMYGTWNWPPYAAPACGYVWVNSYGPVAGNGFTSVTKMILRSGHRPQDFWDGCLRLARAFWKSTNP